VNHFIFSSSLALLIASLVYVSIEEEAKTGVGYFDVWLMILEHSALKLSSLTLQN
jgi:hypothetical protein